MTNPPKQTGAGQPGIPPAYATPLLGLVGYSEGAVVSRTVAKSSAGTLTLFAFDAGQGLSEHSAPFDAWVLVLDGAATFMIGDKELSAGAGEVVLMPAEIPHAVTANEPFKMLLVMFKHQP